MAKKIFQIQPAPTFWDVLNVPVPGGQPVPIEVEFAFKNRDDFDDYMKRAGAAMDREAEVDLFMEVVKDWKDVSEPYGREAVAALLQNYIGVGAALVSDYVRALMEGRRKN